jgi:MoaA/NifB/PqqE/SkfB family radical SAM enzyme
MEKYFDLKVGFTCNNNCVHCVVTDKRSTKDLTTQEIKQVIDTIDKEYMVGFTGGEATIRKDFLEILQYAKQTGHKTALQTNGTGLANDDLVKEVSKYLDHVLIAIHSHLPEVHDKIVSSKGMFEKTISGFKNIIKYNIPHRTQTVISLLNIPYLLETYDFIQSISPGIEMNLTYPHPNGNAYHNADKVVPRFADIDKFIKPILKKYSNLVATEAIPMCYLYPYQDSISYNHDENIVNMIRAGVDPANKDNQFFDKNGFTENYAYSQLDEKRKGPKCIECTFNNRCVGVWKEYMEFHKHHLDLFPVNSDQIKHAEAKQTLTSETSAEEMAFSKWGAIIIYGSTHCMNRCTFCTGTCDLSESTEQRFNKFIKDANHFIDLDFKSIEISGSDPGQYVKIVDAIRYLTDHGITTIQLSTHGRTLKDEKLVKDLAAAGLTSCRIPLYGSTSEIHNKTALYRISGERVLTGDAFEESVAGIKNCIKHGIKVNGHTVINQFNKNDLKNILDLYLKLTDGFMVNMAIGAIGIAELNYNYTSNWYLPIKDMGSFISQIIDHPIGKMESIQYTILDLPYCVIGKWHKNIENINNFPNLGIHKVEKENQSSVSEYIPHYRIKSYFHECEDCDLKDCCAGIALNELKMFGTYGLKAVKEVPENV